MKVLWFEVTKPAGYSESNQVIGGWQDSLESIVKASKDIELNVAFASDQELPTKNEAGVTYIPICAKQNFIQRLRSIASWGATAEVLVHGALKTVEDVKPDIIHVFGLEWPWGLLSHYTQIPVVIHIQGSMVPYLNALYPPKYNLSNYVKTYFPNILKIFAYYLSARKQTSRMMMEKEVWKCVKNYMGRTDWDYALSRVMAPNSRYWHVDEALRPVFLEQQEPHNHFDGKIRIMSTGCGTFWKGPDMLLKTAKILKDSGVDFEWKVAGEMQDSVKKLVEKTEHLRFEDCNVSILGFQSPSDLIDLMKSSSIYVHTAYIENSPNSICEAQCLGLPVISTNVGGISTLVIHEEDGILVPANDPWQMAFNIVDLYSDKKRYQQMSERSRIKALHRHSADKLLSELKTCYNDILKEK